MAVMRPRALIKRKREGTQILKAKMDKDKLMVVVVNEKD